MPAAVDPDPTTVATLLEVLPSGGHGVDSLNRFQAWLTRHSEEYVVVVGPNVAFDEAVAVCEDLRTTRPTVSVILVRHEVDTSTLTQAMKSGMRDVVAADDLAAVTSAVDRAHQLYVALRGPAGAMHSGKIITIFSPKGGVGKTTISVNLALALSDGGTRKVCLVDLDLAFGDVAITMQLFPTHSIEHAIGSQDSMDQAMLGALLTRHEDSLMVLAAPSHPDARERITPPLVTKVLQVLRESFDYIVVDCAPAFDEQTLTALDETDECIVVAALDVPTLKNVKVALETLDALNIAKGHRHLLLNRADDEVGIRADKVESILGMGVSTQVATSIEIAAATNAGMPIVLSNPAHQSSVAIRRLATELAGEPVGFDHAAQSDPGSEKTPRRFRIRK